MSNYLSDIKTKIIKDGYGNIAPQRQVLRINDASWQDDPINEETVLTINSAGTSATLAQVLTNGNNALSQSITGLADPVFSQDAATKAYVDIHSGGNLAVTLAKGNNADGYEILNLDAVEFNGTVPAQSTGKLYYDSGIKCLSYHTDVPGVSVQIGEEIQIRVVNKTGTTILNGQVCYLDTVQGNRPTVKLASNLDANAVTKTIGVCTADILNNQEGLVTTFGYVRDINTSGYAPGDSLYLGVTPGSITNILPTGKNKIVRLGHAINSTNNGALFIIPKPPRTIEDQNDVNEGSPSIDGYHLISKDGYWTRSDFTTDVNNAVNVITDKLVYEGTVPAGSDGYLVVQRTPSNSLLYVNLLNKSNKKWSRTSISTSGDGTFSYVDDFDVYADRSRLLPNGMEIRVVTDINYSYLYIWKKSAVSQDFKLVLTKDLQVPTWNSIYAGTIIAGSSYVTIGNIPLSATFNGIFEYNLWSSTQKKTSKSEINVKVESALSSYCSVDGIDDYASSFERQLPNGKWIKFNRSGQNIEVQLKADAANYDYRFAYQVYIQV